MIDAARSYPVGTDDGGEKQTKKGASRKKGMYIVVDRMPNTRNRRKQAPEETVVQYTFFFATGWQTCGSEQETILRKLKRNTHPTDDVPLAHHHARRLPACPISCLSPMWQSRRIAPDERFRVARVVPGGRVGAKGGRRGRLCAVGGTPGVQPISPGDFSMESSSAAFTRLHRSV